MFSADVVIVGAGMVGMMAAISLARRGFSVIVLEKKPALHFSKDQRVLNIAMDVAHRLAEEDIFLGEGSCVQNVTVSFQKESFGLKAADLGVFCLSYMTPWSYLYPQILQAFKKVCLEKSCTVLWAASPTHYFLNGQHIYLETSSNHRIKASLWILADGGKSALGKGLGSLKFSLPFPQEAFIFSLKHDLGTHAFEHFFPGGSVALLPAGSETGVVWVDRKGKPFFPPEIMNSLFCFFPFLLGTPLFNSWHTHGLDASIQLSKNHRCVLVGDAAHVIHPIAGMGLNVGLREVFILCDLLWKSKQSGMDFGHETVLNAFYRHRRPTALGMFAATTAIVQGFSLLNSYPFWSFSKKTIEMFPFFKELILKKSCFDIKK